jgi:ubiquitin carboxyl-terminal hydrolase L3
MFAARRCNAARASALAFVRPAAGNACGTIGILHAVANLSTHTGGEVALAPDSFFDKFVKATLEATPEERAEALEKDDSIDESHAAVAQQGQSEVVDDTYNHFIAFVAKGGHLYEMDGRKEFPINHGPTSEETLLEVRARIQSSCRCYRRPAARVRPESHSATASHRPRPTLGPRSTSFAPTCPAGRCEGRAAVHVS